MRHALTLLTVMVAVGAMGCDDQRRTAVVLPDYCDMVLDGAKADSSGITANNFGMDLLYDKKATHYQPELGLRLLYISCFQHGRPYGCFNLGRTLIYDKAKELRITQEAAQKIGFGALELSCSRCSGEGCELLALHEKDPYVAYYLAKRAVAFRALNGPSTLQTSLDILRHQVGVQINGSALMGEIEKIHSDAFDNDECAWGQGTPIRTASR